MRLCVVGLGAIGIHLSARLGASGHAVSALARGAALEAARGAGVTLRIGGETVAARIEASDDPAALGRQDAVFVAVKGPSLAALLPRIEPLVGPATLVAFIQNGIPWWYPIGLPERAPRPPDLPMFRLAEGFSRFLAKDRIVGGVIHSGNQVTSPGIARNTSPGDNRLWIGGADERPENGGIAELRAALGEAGIPSPGDAEIRHRLWAKLVFNIGASGIAVLTRNEESIVRRDPRLGEIFLRLMRDAMAVAAANGYPLDGAVDPVAVRARTVDHRSAMLQDLEQGRAMEVAEIFLAPQALGAAAGVDTPTLDAVAALIAGLERSRPAGATA